MNAGDLNKRITLQRLVPVDDGEGGFAETWTDYGTVWANVSPVTQRQRDVYDQTQSEISHKITLRYRSDVLPTDRVTLNGRVFEQEGPPVNVKEQGVWLQLLCREVFLNG